MITLKMTIDAQSYREHIEEAEATEAEASEKLRQDMTQALQTFGHYDLMVDAIRCHRAACLEIFLYDSWAALPDAPLAETDEQQPRRRHYEKEGAHENTL